VGGAPDWQSEVLQLRPQCLVRSQARNRSQISNRRSNRFFHTNFKIRDFLKLLFQKTRRQEVKYLVCMKRHALAERHGDASTVMLNDSIESVLLFRGTMYVEDARFPSLNEAGVSE
jgi:hypothetical protein